MTTTTTKRHGGNRYRGVSAGIGGRDDEGVLGGGGTARSKSKGLRPYLCPDRRRTPNFFRKWIIGGVPILIWPFLIGGIIITIGWNILWITEVIPPSIQPISQFWIGQVVFIIAFILGNLFMNGNNKYKSSLENWYLANGSQGSLAHDFVANINKKVLCEKKGNCEVIAALFNAFHLTRTISYAFKWDFRNSLIPNRLPIPTVLQRRLQCFGAKDKFPAITRNIAESVPVLIRHGIFVNPMEGIVSKHTTNLATIFQKIIVTRRIQFPPVYRAHFWIIVITYFVFIFLYLFPLFSWFDLGVTIYLVYAILGLIRASQAVRNPFESPDDNAFMSEIFLGEDADEAAQESDAHFCDLFRDVGIQVQWECDGALIALTKI